MSATKETEIVDVKALAPKISAEQKTTFVEIQKHSDLQLNREQAKIMVQSGLLPKHLDTPEKVFTVWLYGKALGLEIAQAVQDIYVVNGMACLSAKMMKALVHQKMPKAIFKITKSDELECIIEAGRDANSITTYRFTREKAERAGITTKPEYVNGRPTGKRVLKDNWANWGEEMLRWRNIAQVCRIEFYDCFLGVGAYSPEELVDDTDPDGRPTSLRHTDPRRNEALAAIKNKYKALGQNRLKENADGH